MAPIRRHRRALPAGFVIGGLAAACGDGGTPPPPPPPAAALVLETSLPASVKNRYALPTAPVVQLVDAASKSVAQAGVAITVSLSGGGTLLGTATRLTDVGGSAAFPGLSIAGRVGPRTLTFAAPGLESASASLVLGSGDPASMAKDAPDDQSATAGYFVFPPSVKVTDADDNPVSGVSATFQVTGGGGSITGTSAVTSASGVVRASDWRLGLEPGTNTASAAVAALGSVSFTATSLVWSVQVLSLGTPSCGIAASITYCWGSGPVGDGTTTARPRPTPVSGNVGLVAVSSGGGHACGLTGDGVAYCWGGNSRGQLGDGTTVDRLVPTAVAGAHRWKEISAGTQFTCGLTTAGAAYCWGSNSYGQMGDGSPEDFFTPHPTPSAVLGGRTYDAISARGHACALSGGVAFCWGRNAEGQLGDGTTTHRNAPVAVGGGLTFQRIAVGGNHTCAVTSSGTYCWGSNRVGQMGDGTTGSVESHKTPSPVVGGHTFVTVVAGIAHSCGLTNDGAAFCWGSNSIGQRGDNSTAADSGTPLRVTGGLVLQSIAAGEWSSGGLTARGAYAWGSGTQTSEQGEVYATYPVGVRRP